MSRKPLFVIYPNQRITPELWAKFTALAHAQGRPPGVKLYEAIVRAIEDDEPCEDCGMAIGCGYHRVPQQDGSVTCITPMMGPSPPKVGS